MHGPGSCCFDVPLLNLHGPGLCMYPCTHHARAWPVLLRYSFAQLARAILCKLHGPSCASKKPHSQHLHGSSGRVRRLTCGARVRRHGALDRTMSQFHGQKCAHGKSQMPFLAREAQGPIFWPWRPRLEKPGFGHVSTARFWFRFQACQKAAVREDPGSFREGFREEQY